MKHTHYTIRELTSVSVHTEVQNCIHSHVLLHMWRYLGSIRSSITDNSFNANNMV